jgi:hypothetical protein
MTINQRRILYSLFILIFLIATPLISLYATGYKIGGDFKIQKTGALIIDTEPPGAQIFLNSKLQKKFLKNIFTKNDKYLLSPVKIKNLKPGDYDIYLELNGYWPWQKKLTINPGQSTYIEDVNLFKNDTPILISNGKLDNFIISPKNENIIAFDENNIKLINQENFKLKSFNFASSSILENIDEINLKNTIFSPNKEKVIIANFIFNEDDWKNPLDLKNIIGGELSDAKWGNDNNIIYYQEKNNIYSFNLESKLSKNILKSSEIHDFIIKKDFLYTIENDNLSSLLSIWDLKKEEYLKKIKLPLSDYEFTHPKHNLINLYDHGHKALHLIDPFSEFRPLKETINNISKNSTWVNENRLLYYNDFEVWILDIINGSSVKKTLLTRISEKIENATWHPSDNYIFYEVENKIRAIELDDRNNYNITEIINLKNLENMHLNKKGDLIFFYTKIGNQEGVYKLYIQ